MRFLEYCSFFCILMRTFGNIILYCSFVPPSFFSLIMLMPLSAKVHSLHPNPTVPTPGQVDLVGAGPGDPELLTLKAYRLISQAQLIIHDRLIAAPILDLAPADANLIAVGKQGFGASWSQSDINHLLIKHAQQGMDIVRLKSGDATLFGRLDEEIQALSAADIAWSIVPGITAASAATAAIGQSLTRRQRNASIQFLTGHDMAGFAHHDWRALARPGNVAAIYMGMRAARFLQGHLLMQGAAPSTPISIIISASRPDQHIIAATLGSLVDHIQATDLSGPAILLYGLAPRDAVAVELPIQQAAV